MKLTGSLTLDMAKRFRGVADTYMYKGLPVARRWPRPPTNPNSPGQRATRNALPATLKWIRAAPPWFNDAWRTNHNPPTASTTDCKRKVGLWLANGQGLPRVPNVAPPLCIYYPAPNTTSITIRCQLNTNPDHARFAWYVQLDKTVAPLLQWTCISTRKKYTDQTVEYYQPTLGNWILPTSQTWHASRSSYTIAAQGRPTLNNLLLVATR